MLFLTSFNKTQTKDQVCQNLVRGYFTVTPKKLVEDGICVSLGEARRLIMQMPNEEALQKFIKRKSTPKKPKLVLTALAQEYGLSIQDVMDRFKLKREEIFVEGLDKADML